MVIILLIL